MLSSPVDFVNDAVVVVGVVVGVVFSPPLAVVSVETVAVTVAVGVETVAVTVGVAVADVDHTPLMQPAVAAASASMSTPTPLGHALVGHDQPAPPAGVLYLVHDDSPSAQLLANENFCAYVVAIDMPRPPQLAVGPVHSVLAMAIDRASKPLVEPVATRVLRASINRSIDRNNNKKRGRSSTFLIVNPKAIFAAWLSHFDAIKLNIVHRTYTCVRACDRQ